MILNISVEDRTYRIDVPQDVLDEGEPFFQKMDEDMNRGWQMSREYVPNPDVEQRCQIAADRLLTAMHNENKHSLLLMAGYIIKRLPSLERVDIDATGNMNETRFHFEKK